MHTQFFHAYDARTEHTLGKGHKKPSNKRLAYDVTVSSLFLCPLVHPAYKLCPKKIIPQIREETLAGVHILFSSVIPLDTRPESAEIWRMAHMFGAQCSTELTSDVTHVVAAKVHLFAFHFIEWMTHLAFRSSSAGLSRSTRREDVAASKLFGSLGSQIR